MTIICHGDIIRGIARICIVPRRWNVAAFQLIWKNKGKNLNAEIYRPIYLTSMSG